MSASPFQFHTHKGQQFVEHDVQGFNGTLESGLMAQDQVQALIAEHIKAIDELSGTETVAMIRLPIASVLLHDIEGSLIGEHGRRLVMERVTNGWLRVWKKNL